MTRKEFYHLIRKFNIPLSTIAAILSTSDAIIRIRLFHAPLEIPQEIEYVLWGMIVKSFGLEQHLGESPPNVINVMLSAAEYADSPTIKNALNEVRQRDSLLSIMTSRKSRKSS
jgi:hypothetical protein